MVTNPYAPQSTPPVLAGRETELDTIKQMLTPMLANHSAAQGATVVYGVRGIGKTSLLRAIADQAQAEYGLLTSWTSAAKGKPLLPALVASIRRTLERSKLIPSETWRVQKVGLEFGVAPLKATASAEKKVQGQEVWNVASLENFIREAGELALDHGGSNKGTGFLVIVDELHAAPKSDLAILLNALQNISHDYDSPPVAFLAAGLPSVRGTLTAAATFGERTAFIPLGKLSPAATSVALDIPAKENGVKYTKPALAILEEKSLGYPYFVQLLGYNTWEQVNPQLGASISAADALAGVQRAQRAISDLFEARYNSATKSEKAFMIALAHVSGDLPATRQKVAEKLGKTSQTISSVRSQLLGKAIISEPARGEVQFTLPGFAEFVKEKSS